MSSLAGKVALVTGGSKGIGAALVLHLAVRGVNVAVNYSSDSKAADETIRKINTTSKGIAIQADAVPVAGVMLMKTLEQTSEQDFDVSYNLNVKGPYFLAQKAVPHMSAGGRIVFISTSVYNLSVVSPNQGHNQRPRQQGINVNGVAPGPAATELFYKGKTEQAVQTTANMSPYRKIGEPEDVAEATGFFCGQRSRWATGQTLWDNGGMT